MQNGVAVSVSELKQGMLIMALDRPWLETPFLIQGFTIAGDDEIKTLKDFCQYVYVEQSTLPPHLRSHLLQTEQSSQEHTVPISNAHRISDPSLWVDQDNIPVEKELEKASEATDALNNATEALFSGLKNGGDLDLHGVNHAVGSMVSSVIRNPDAMLWLMRVKNSDEYTYRHAIGTSVWAVVIGRQLGFSRSELDSLALGALLCDIGKSRIDDALLSKPCQLTPHEFEVIKHHVQHSLDMLQEAGNVDDVILQVVANHHERHDGSGYPNGLAGTQIPVFARIASIADCYDAMISNRVFQSASAPSHAIKKLYEWRNREFQAELVETFIYAVGVYPAGSVVELNDGRVAIVFAEGRKNRLRPKVFVVLDADKNPLREPLLLDLSSEVSKYGTSSGLGIEKSLPLGSYGIDPQAFYL